MYQTVSKTHLRPPQVVGLLAMPCKPGCGATVSREITGRFLRFHFLRNGLDESFSTGVDFFTFWI